MPLEGFVRPFQLPNPSPGDPVFNAVTEPEIVRLQIGRAGGTANSFAGAYSYDGTFYVPNTQIEKT